MKILAHRGVWKVKTDRNSLSALKCAIDNNFGLETDLRDLDGQLVISHDIPNSSSVIYFEDLLEYYIKNNSSSLLALNIKSDGLQDLVLRQLKQYKITQYFVFDMSIPDTINYFKYGLPVYIRNSELESYEKLENQSQGIWVDEMIDHWLNYESFLKLISQNKDLAFVSPELHGRSHINFWNNLKSALRTCPESSIISLCTDYPFEAELFFK